MGPAFAGGVAAPFVASGGSDGRVVVMGVGGGEAKDDKLVVDAAGEGGTEPS